MRFLPAIIVLALFLLMPTSTPAQIPDGLIKQLEDGGLLIKDIPVMMTLCEQPLLFLIPQPVANEFAVYVGPAMMAKSPTVFKTQYLTFDIASTVDVDCDAPQKEQQPRRKKFYRTN